ncbi:FAD-binding domain-containing protein [Piscinibacter sp. HJYY11]|uniref:FAD-binding domain-containing protein n=1 Tax=Piscinibacter sp. HJYY11 TaxID=2801333 RepID=UPI00191CF738|nr:FAD-binding domain-containing protein [Piscinibacter sp. HJYY11]MBL0726634.1 deoxyribodipyrimidine photolyase [Piscinibacter sp. HJYY11]
MQAPAPTLAAAHQRIAAVRPEVYARTRNALDGAVSGLSPYITHGFVSLSDVLSGVSARHSLQVQHRFVYELGWRAYFRHQWQHHGEGIFRSLHEGPLHDGAYAMALPADIREGRTGVQAIDQAVRTLYRTGLLHNHARMWLASYVVHLRKVHWRAGADWLYGHLLDGDLASNHLSWQWVAGTASHKPYLFNADNVARHAPSEWHSAGSVVDTSYEVLDRIAHTASERSAVEPTAREDDPCPEPERFTAPPAGLGTKAPNAAVAAGYDVWIVHPWNLGALPDSLPDRCRVIGIFTTDFHRAWPWTERRWRFVGERMAELTSECWYGDANAVGAALQGAMSVCTVDDPHLSPWLRDTADCAPAPRLFPHINQRCDSFSQWWARASLGLNSAADLLALAQRTAE